MRQDGQYGSKYRDGRSGEHVDGLDCVEDHLSSWWFGYQRAG